MHVIESIQAAFQCQVLTPLLVKNADTLLREFKLRKNASLWNILRFNTFLFRKMFLTSIDVRVL